MQKTRLDRVRASLGWPLLALFVLLILSSTGAQLHGRLLLLGDWLFGDYYLVRADMPAPTCNPAPDIQARIQALELEANSSSGLDALFDDDSSFDAQAARQSLESARDLCLSKYELYESASQRVTRPVKIFRTFEVGLEFFTLLVFDYQRWFIICLLFLGAICATTAQHHIAFRPITTIRQHRLSHGVELIAQLLFLLPSVSRFYAQKQLEVQANTSVAIALLTLIGVVVFVVTTAIRFVYPPLHLENKTTNQNNTWSGDLLCIPIYVYMLCIAGYYFIVAEQHTTGIAIYIGQLFEQADMFLKVGLYIWLGMLLKRSRLGHQLFGLLRPWGFPPEIVAFFAVLLMAIPTAYTGASGIIIIAMGAVVYQTLIDSGARRSLALAATAMTGSSGVVLRPCLMIVIIAALNKDVVTADLYLWGGRVFLLSALILAVALGLMSQKRLSMKSWAAAKPDFYGALMQMRRPAFVFVCVTLSYYYLLDAKLDEMSAPIVLPIIVLIILWFDRHEQPGLSPSIEDKNQLKPQAAPPARQSFFQLVLSASQEASLHTGALLMLMACSFAIGGVIERTEVVMLLPETFQSIWVCMAMLVVVLVMIGMVMDPFGAVVLVSGSLATLAYNNDIAPLHFWMVTLVAFELGYLSPPVALNHLLTRQVIGEAEAEKARSEAVQALHWWLRYEKILLPICVMTITLFITAFVPLLF